MTKAKTRQAAECLTLPPLPYALEALEPHLSRHTLELHHGKHHAAYVEKTQALVAGTPLEAATLEEIVHASSELPDRALFNAAAQAWNHEFYWQSMTPGGGGEPQGAIKQRLDKEFGSYRKFCESFTDVAESHFGSGWCWLVLDGDQLRICATSNAETPLTGAQRPLLVLDVWEHAYYPDYEHDRPRYVSAFLKYLVNWNFANKNIELATAAGGRAAQT